MNVRIGINGFGRIGRGYGADSIIVDGAKGEGSVEWGYTCRLADLALIVGRQHRA